MEVGGQMPKNRSRGPEAVSPELDTLSCDLIESALDTLAEGGELGVIAVYENASGARSNQVFDGDSPDACIDAAHSYIRTRKDAVRYGIVYDGAIAERNGSFKDAVILEFGEKDHCSRLLQSPNGYTLRLRHHRSYCHLPNQLI